MDTLLEIKSNKIRFKKGGASAVCEVMQRYEKQAVLSTLISLVKKGALALSDAAKEAHLTEEEFKERMNKA